MSETLEDTSSLIRTYALFIIGTVLMCIPVTALMILGGVLTTIGFFGSFGLKKKLKDTTIGITHARWTTRTIWISLVYFLAGTVCVFAILNANADKTATMQLAEAITAGTATPDQITAMTRQYQSDNQTLIFWTYLGFYGPVLAFFMARMIKGYVLAEKYQPIPNPKTWAI